MQYVCVYRLLMLLKLVNFYVRRIINIDKERNAFACSLTEVYTSQRISISQVITG